MKRILMVVAVALAAVSCLKNDELGVEGSKNYAYAGSIVTRYSDSGEVAYDSTTVTSEDGSEKRYNANVEVPDVNVKSLNIAFEGVNFIARMPELAITIPELAYTDESGLWVINCPSVIPTIKGIEYPDFEMRELTCTINGESLHLEFDITAMGTDYRVVYSALVRR